MIIFIIVPPGDQLFSQRTLHDLFCVTTVPRLICVVPESESQSWWGTRPWCELLTYDEYDLRAIRATILNEFEDEDVHVIARYDLALSRRLPRINRLTQCTKLDIQVLMKWIQETEYDHGSVSERHRNKTVSEKDTTIAAPSLLNFYRPETILGFDFLNSPETLIDQDLTLELLRAGHKNIVNHEFACRSVSTTQDITKEDAFELEHCHPGLVEAVEVRPGTWSVTSQWSRAYDTCSKTRR